MKDTETKITSTEGSDYGFYSRLLDKVFNSVDELKAAEKAELDARHEKEQKAVVKKAEATKVEDAYKAYAAAVKVRDSEISKAKKTCAEAIAEAKSTYFAEVNKAQEKLDAAEVAYNTALQEFLKNHPEGFHTTYRDGDTITTLSYNIYRDMLNSFDNFYDSLMKLF